MIGTLLNAGLCAANVTLYAAHDDPLNLGAAAFCGLVAIICGVRER